MSDYALTPLAKTDIFDIWSYIAGDSPDAADRVEQAIYDACAFLPTALYVVIFGRISQHGPSVSGPSPAIPTTPLFIGLKRLRFKLSPCCMGKEISNAFLKIGANCGLNRAQSMMGPPSAVLPADASLR